MKIDIGFLCKQYIQMAYENMCKLANSDNDRAKKIYPIWHEIAKDDIDLEARLEYFIKFQLHAEVEDFALTTFIINDFAYWMLHEEYMKRQSYIEAVTKSCK